MGPYGIDLRTRIVEAYDNGEGSVRELAERFAVAPNTVQNYLTLRRATGSVAPRPHGGGTPPMIDKRGREQLRALVEATPDATEEELADTLARRHHVVVSGSTVGRAIRRMKLTWKKNASRDRARSTGRARQAGDLHNRRRRRPTGKARVPR